MIVKLINSLFVLIVFVPVLVLVLILVNLLLSQHLPDSEKNQPYECGFSPVYGQTRSNFQIHFFIVALLFLIFDLEILLLFPISVTLYQVSFFGFSICLIFFSILTLGFILEIANSAIQLTDINTGEPLYE